jgi:hypothetical protein
MKHDSLVVLGLSFWQFLHLRAAGLPSNVESSNSLKNRFPSSSDYVLLLKFFLQLHRSLDMQVSPHLHGSIPHVEKLADLLVFLPVFL